MASKQVQDLLVRLKIDGLEGLDSLKGAFRELAKTIGPTEQVIEKARQSIIEFGEAGNKSEQLIKGQIEAFKGLRSQATQGGKVYKELTADIKKLEGAAYGASPAVESQRKALTALGSSADATASQIEQAINSLINLRGEVRVDSQAFDNFGKSIAELTDRFRAVNQEAQNFAQAQQRIARPIGATSAAARQQIRDLDLVTESLREQRDFLGALEGEARIKSGAASLAARQAPASGRRTFEEAVSESAFGGDIKKLLPAKDIKAALDEVKREIANFQQEIEAKLSRKIQISFQETARAGRESARAMAAAFSDPELINVFNQFDKRLGELPDTTTGLNQELSELSQRLANTKRNTVDYLVVAMQMAGVQRELTAVTQGYAQSLLMGIRTGTVAPSARNLQEVIAALRAEMSQLDTTTSEGARSYAENAREARALEQRLNGLANAYRNVGDMAAQAATAETSAATARITANYLNRGIVRQQEEAMAELGQRVRTGVAATPLALPAAGQTTAPGTGLEISGGARVGRATGRIQRFFTGFDVGDAQLQMPGAPQAQGPQATEKQAERARRAAISEAEAVRTAAEARQQAEQQIQSYRAEIDKARRADIGSIDSTQRLREAINQYRSTLPGASAEFKKLTKELGELDVRSEKLGRGLGRRRISGLQVAQAAGAALSGGIFGGPEGFLGGALGGVVGGVGGAFAGAAAGAQIGALRQQLGGFADYAAQIQKLEIALKNAAGSQDQFNQAIAAADAATRNLNVPQDVAIKGITQLTAAVKGAGGQVSDAELVFKNVTAAIKATGGSAEDVDGAITALVQVFSKGKVSAEELSGQLGERLPGAVTKFAKANELTLPELQKALEQGQVGLNELLKFIVELGNEYSGVAEQIAGSSQDAGARLTVAYNQLKLDVGAALQPIGAQFQEAFIPFIEGITPVLVDVLPKIGEFVLALAKNFDTLAIAAAAALGVFAVGKIAAIGGVGAALLKLAAAAGTASVSLKALNAAALLNPWTALAAGVAAVGVAFFEANKEKERFDAVISSGTTDELAAEFERLQQKIIEASSRTASYSSDIRGIGNDAGYASIEIRNMRNELERIKGEYRVRLLFEQAGLDPEKGFYTPVGKAKPKVTDFPRFDEGKDRAGRTKKEKERESQLPQLLAELAVRQQIAGIEEKIRNAQLAENQFLQIRLEGERELAEIAGRINAIKFEKISANEAKVKRDILLVEVDKARANILQRLAQAEKQSIKEITQESNNLADTYTAQVEERKRFLELVAGGTKDALALEFIQIEKILEKEKELLEVERARLEAVVEAGGPGAAKARSGIANIDDLLGGLDKKEAKLKGLAESAQIGKIQEFIDQAEAELRDLEGLAVRISQGIGDAIGSSIANGITGLIEGTTNVKQIFANFLKDIGQILIQEGAKIIATYIAIGIAKQFAGFLGGGSQSASNFELPNQAFIPSGGFKFPGAANGAYFAGGQANFAQNSVQPFASGGIVTKPTFFKYADGGAGRFGLMGEAGPEAIIPLKRGADGRLGVSLYDASRKAVSEAETATSLNSAEYNEDFAPGFAGSGGKITAASAATARAVEANRMQIMQQQSTNERLSEIRYVEQMMSKPAKLDIKYESQVINNVEYVTRDQAERLASQSALRGRELAINALQTSVKTRKRVGMT